MDWFRMYAEFATDPKVQMMPEAMQRRLVMLLCLQCGNGIETFHETERESSIAFALRISEAELAETKELFMRKEFINSDWTLRNWDKRQYASDSSTARVRRHREKSKKATETDETFQERSSNALEQNRTDTEQIKETPPTPRKRGSGFDASSIELPAWLDLVDWQSWVADRKARKKPITEEGARRQLKQLADYRADGHQPADVIANSIAGGYQGLFPPRGQIRASPPSRAQAMADWNAELGEVLAEGRRPSVIDMGTIDATH
ncbi:hypothetical protein CS344_20145 [Bordetella bronchiseptica]|uniref:hypothetical protein n=2 Tax=Bordetella bronchiseptica TaxID=518 RepID=UPI000FD7F4B0|nr:hypothetical protein [Bordetella bronchiseptica]AZW14227.1 hypothetical protein CS344_20145 [Bordetella bronchiseptica]QBS70763.1 hypothetical protein B2C13_19835 [Bordetella bronchiseptica]